MDQTAILPQALAPYRVLDLTSDLGALCGRVLADMGADVIKVEPPDGDPARLIGPFVHGERRPDRSLSWLYAHAGKRGITLDLCREEGRALLRRLAAVSDFVVESFPPGRLDELGIAWDVLAALNPALILVSVTPFGQQEPYRSFKSTDLIAWATGGHMELAGDADRPPVRVSVPISWNLAGAHAAAGALTAHAARVRSGLGQRVDISAQEAVTWTLMIAAQIWDVQRINPRRGGAVRIAQRPGREPLAARTIWPCRDGYIYWAISGGSQAGAVHSMRALVGWMTEEGQAGGLEEVEWQGFAAAALDQDDYDRLAAPFQRFFLTRTKRELFEGAIARAIQLAPINTIADHFASPQLAARHYFTAVEHPDLGLALEFPGPPVRMSRTPWRIARAAPRLGEHDDAVYGELLGLSAGDVHELRTRGLI